MKNNFRLLSHARVSHLGKLGMIFFLGIVSCAAQVATSELEETAAKPANKGILVGLAAKLVMGNNGGDKLFYMPMKSTGITPDKYGIRYDEVFFHSADKTKLHGWFMPARTGVKNAKGTIVFSHGNAGEVIHHLSYVDGLIAGGYNVLLYDYRGFGKSEGTVDKEGIIADVAAAFRYIKTRKDIDQNKIISVSHSLGGAKSIAALAKYHPKGLRAIVVMNTFSSYRKMALLMAGDSARYVVTDTYNPIDLVKELPKVPFLVMHADNDQLIPSEQGEEIYIAANQPKTMMKLKSGSHSRFLSVNGHENEKKLLKWLETSLK